MSAPVSPLWLLRSQGPVSLRSSRASGSVDVDRAVRCACGRESDWLIIADVRCVVLVCRCGRRRSYPGLSLVDVVALVHEVPMRPAWSSAEDAVRALGFAPHERGLLGRVGLSHRRPKSSMDSEGPADRRNDA